MREIPKSYILQNSKGSEEFVRDCRELLSPDNETSAKLKQKTKSWDLRKQEILRFFFPGFTPILVSNSGILEGTVFLIILWSIYGI